jgi:hypothetical protein
VKTEEYYPQNFQPRINQTSLKMIRRKEMIRSGVELQEKANRTASKDYVVEVSKQKAKARQHSDAWGSSFMQRTEDQLLNQEARPKSNLKTSIAGDAISQRQT